MGTTETKLHSRPKPSLEVWICTKCNDLKYSRSDRRWEMDICGCGHSAVDKEEWYSRILGYPKTLLIAEIGSAQNLTPMEIQAAVEALALEDLRLGEEMQVCESHEELVYSISKKWAEDYPQIDKNKLEERLFTNTEG